ncbi:hypothetical protein AB0B31_28355 [Catellatospora citrea]|uniref:hypothetical protein n=1 Tax=Catellatospora citrea TaxID=53366 RepID=UPI0033F44559
MTAGSGMRVLFVALGASRRRIVVEESAQVVADGGTAVVVVSRRAPWAKETFAPQVKVVELDRLEQRGVVAWLARALLFGAPRLLFRLVGHGPLRAPAHRAAGGYERRVAAPVHRRMFLPVYRRLWRDPRGRALRGELAATAPDLIVVSDPASMPDVARVMESRVTGVVSSPRIAFSLG